MTSAATSQSVLTNGHSSRLVRCGLLGAALCALVGGAPAARAQGLPANIESAITTCINEAETPPEWTAIEPDEITLTALTWADALQYIVSSDMAEMIVEERSWLEDEIRSAFQDSSFWVGADADNNRYRLLAGPDGWKMAAIIGKDHADYQDGYANCYLWHEAAQPDAIAWVTQWDFFDPRIALLGAEEPRLWRVNHAHIEAETSYSNSAIEVFAVLLEPDVIAAAPRTTLVITRELYTFEGED